MRQRRDKARPEGASELAQPPPSSPPDFQAYLDMCEAAWEAGEPFAVCEALTWSRLHRQPAPAWVDEAVFRLARHRRSRADDQQLSDAQRQLLRYITVRNSKTAPDATWDDAYEAASKKLKGTFARGSAETMKAAYSKVAGELGRGRSGKYFTGTKAEWVGGAGPMSCLADLTEAKNK